MSLPPPARPDRLALLELDALLGHVIRLRDAGDRHRYDTDLDYRWALHRAWIAAGNEALSFAEASGLDRYRAQPWARMYRQRNLLAHQRLPDIDEDGVWRATVLRAEQQYVPAVHANLR
ncbi:MAG: hypothetical protein ACRDNS_19215 [Trebonia sp.]